MTEETLFHDRIGASLSRNDDHRAVLVYFGNSDLNSS